MEIRVAEAAELPGLRELEVAAGTLFAEVGMAFAAEFEPWPVPVMEKHRGAGTLWVSLAGGVPVGYLMAHPLDGAAHIEQVSVHPEHGRQGRGRALIEHAAAWATGAGHPALTLTTYRDVPWNAPFYRTAGFRDLPPAEETPGLRRIRAREASMGLDRWPRLCMRRDL